MRFSGLMGGRIGGFAIRNVNAFVNVMIPLGTPRSTLGSEVMRAYRRPMGTRDHRQATHIFPRELLGSTAFLSSALAGLEHLADKPVPSCWGDEDRALPKKERSRFEVMLRRAKVVALPGAGHYVQEESPAKIATAICTWWPEAEAGP